MTCPITWPPSPTRCVEVRTGDLDVDLASALQPFLEQAGLLGHGNGAGQPGDGMLHERHQLAGAVGVVCAEAHKHHASGGHKEEVANDGKIELLCLRTFRLDVPIGPQLFFDRSAEPHQFVEIVSRRRQHEADHQVAISGRQIFDLRPKQPRQSDGNSQHRQDDGQAPPSALQRPTVNPDHKVREAGAKGIQRSDRQVGNAIFPMQTLAVATGTRVTRQRAHRHWFRYHLLGFTIRIRGFDSSSGGSSFVWRETSGTWPWGSRSLPRRSTGTGPP